ncbi:diaminobutyrate--2-oxoglutarate transaminase [Prauserella marina]|uniref:Diaminobutyrate--2-oxoglutarate transaminase n=1 Tax=Prauserella marina TaxID=530584 RepID=A0A222VZL4_9PSEU|nr:diaminobutyrate--2-oxoglutarate transaminase [Prauserella marina]ASR39398.1 diaminobutyrate--2-oxoglutarate transaminase [Prauserella marina]PWV73935.1 diaminobutyrate aminotransferase [Prauserella marina]SDD59309.1 diaminobutyrate-2-oxoglutarate transaminase [Prauserella marina]
MNDTDVFAIESEVRAYSRAWPVVFDSARGSTLRAEDGTPYLDFFSGAGALNYGHNNPVLKRALLRYLERDGLTHALDMHTVAKRDFLRALKEIVLNPRGLDYTIALPGPGGTNAVEAALKLARKNTGRHQVLSFTNGFHGMTLGALAVTGNTAKRAGAGLPLGYTTPLPFGDTTGSGEPDFGYLERLLGDSGSGLDRPAAAIVETVQGEGGLNAASFAWLRALREICDRYGVLLIVDDIQMGCGRTGPFFSFEPAGIVPDIVCLSKSISGYGLPMGLLLFAPELDVWAPGEHSGTFRGSSPAFVTAAEALRAFWLDDTLTRNTARLAGRLSARLGSIAGSRPGGAVAVKGRGLAAGLEFRGGDVAEKVCALAFERRLLLETSGPRDQVVKLLPALTISDTEFEAGLDILASAVADAV